MSNPTLPAELWIIVFRHALRHPGYVYIYTESEVLAPNQFRQLNIDVLIEDFALRRALVLVSKRWRGLATEFLYEHVFIKSPEQALALWDTLSASEKVTRGGYGRYVQSALIGPLGVYPGPRKYDATAWISPKIALSVLTKCPNVKTIMRPFWFSFHRPQLPEGQAYHPTSSTSSPLEPKPLTFSYLTRLYWKYNCEDNGPLFHFFVSSLRNLEYLSLSFMSSSGFCRSIFPPTHGLVLPSVTTLRLRIFNRHVDTHIGQWSLPSLTRLIVDEYYFPGVELPQYDCFKGARNLRSIDIGKQSGDADGDLLCAVLQWCPLLQTVSFPILRTRLPPPTVLPPRTLGIVRLLSYQGSSPGNHSRCDDILATRLASFVRWSGKHRSLRSVVLCGEWSGALNSSRWREELRDVRRVFEEPGVSWKLQIENGDRVRFVD